MNEAYLNGNLIREYDKSQLGDEPDALFAVDILAAAENNNPVYGVEGAWGYGYEKKDSNSFGDANFERIYEWDDKNQLIKTKDGLYTTYYVYNNEGDRVAKYTERSETLYFNKFWSWHIDPANAFAGGQLSKHIFLGDTRIVTKLSQETNNYIDAEKQRLYFYHSDHLGSASLITDYKGNEYERLEYTPYGELWVDLSEYTGSTYLPFKFSAKEMDSETGLYYYGARYLDSKYSLWKSTDPALGEYIPKAPVNEQARQYNQNLPGMGGIFNPINANLYHYAGNNPVRYVDPDGRFCISYYYNEKYSRYCYGMFTFHDRSKLISWTYYNIYKGIASWIPFGGLLTNVEKYSENFFNMICGDGYRLIYNSDCATFDFTGVTVDLLTLIFPAAKESKIFDYFAKFLSLKGTYDAFDTSQKDKIISNFLKLQESDLFLGVLYEQDAIFLGTAYAKAALDYYILNVAENNISESDFGKAVRHYLFTGEKNSIFKKIYGDSEF